MHALCNIDLTVVYVDKVQCPPPPFSFSFKLSFFSDQGKLVYDMLCNKIETLLIFIEIAFIATTWNRY